MKILHSKVDKGITFSTLNQKVSDLNWPLEDNWPNNEHWGHMCDSTQVSLYPSPMEIYGNISKHVDTVIIFSKLTLTIIPDSL